jgi:hypothetical protein
MTPQDFFSWQAYFNEPRGEKRADWRSAQIVATLAEINRNPEKNPTRTKTEDCLLRFEEKRKQTWQEQKEFFLDWAGVPKELRNKKRR